MSDVTWAVRPGAGFQERLLVVTRELDAAVRTGSVGEIRRLLAEAEQIASATFLDPAVPALLRAVSRGGGFDDVVGSADRLTSVIRLLEQHATAGSGPTVTTWPAAIRGGERLLHYRLVRYLGGGGMGNVCLGWDEHLDRYVALKRFRDDKDVLRGYRRLEREARAAARLRHENVVLIYALEYVGDEPVLAQEYIDGEDLSARVGKVDAAQATGLAADVARGTAAAHARGILHRDLKPANVRVRPDGTALILDFGLGKAFLASPDDHTQVNLTAEGTAPGTPAYMSPEQLTGAVLTSATDVFSFGVLLYELFSGQLPFAGKTVQELYAAILHGQPPPLRVPDVPKHLAELVFACLQKQATDRPSMVNVLEDLEGSSGVVTMPRTHPGRARLVESIDHSLAQIVATTEQDAAWLHAMRARADVDSHAVTFECDIVFKGRVPDVPLGQMRQLLERIQMPEPESFIGRISDDERYKLRRGANEVFATFALSRLHAYWAAARDGRFFYLSTLPLLERGGIPIESLLGQTLESLRYAARYARIMSGHPRQTRLAIRVAIRNAATHFLVGGDWSHRFAASLDAQHKRADGTAESTLSVAADFLSDELYSCIKLLFDDLMVYFDFLNVPLEYYQHFFQRSDRHAESDT